jgi:hypothetical protein
MCELEITKEVTQKGITQFLNMLKATLGSVQKLRGIHYEYAELLAPKAKFRD